MYKKQGRKYIHICEIPEGNFLAKGFDIELLIKGKVGSGYGTGN